MKDLTISSKKTIRHAMKFLSKTAEQCLFVIDKNGKLLGTITDGDIRRNSNNLYKKKILQVCNKSPTWISENATALSAIEKMNNLKITSLLVAKSQDFRKKVKKVTGILHLHHCLSRGIK